MPTKTIDPITVEVIGSAFSSITEEMGEVLVRSSYSTNIKERRDCSTALLDAEGRTLCQAEHIPMHLGSFLAFIPHLLQRFDRTEIAPGDVFIGNDPYSGGATHLPDIVVACPVYYDHSIVFWVINTAHHSDFADRGHAHIFQEGLRIPPVRLSHKGVIQKDIQDLVLLNCQVPSERLSDLRAQFAANRLGIDRMIRLCGKYGIDVVLGAGEALMAYAERRMRAGIAAIADGTYRYVDVYDTLQIDGEFEMSVAITVAGDEMLLEFQSAPQVRAGLNLVYTALLSAVYYAVKAIVDPTIPPNAGLAVPLKVVAPVGTLINCSHPAAVNQRNNPCQRVVDLIFGALAQAVPERVTAAANGASAVVTFSAMSGADRYWVYLETIGGGSGARATKDGLDGVHVHLTNTSNLPVEALEGEYPLTVLRYDLVNGSGGVGEFRGGMGLRRVYRADEDCRFEVDGSRINSSPWGFAGGGSGGRFSARFGDGNPLPAGGCGILPAGQTIEIVTPGGGGYGDPRKRSEANLAKDGREGRSGPAASSGTASPTGEPEPVRPAGEPSAPPMAAGDARMRAERSIPSLPAGNSPEDRPPVPAALRAVATAMGAFAGWAYMGAAFFISIDVIARKFFNWTTGATIEIGGYLLAFGISWGMAQTMLDRSHIRIDVFIRKAPPRPRMVLHIIALALLLSFILFICWGAIGMVRESILFGAIDGSYLALPLAWPQMLWAVGFMVFAVLLIVMLLQSIRLAARGRVAAVDELLGQRGYKEETAEVLVAVADRKEERPE